MSKAPTADALPAALDRYSAAFRGRGLPFLRGVGPEDVPLVVEMLDRAAAAGQPLGWWEIMARLGFPPPPPGVCL